MEIPTLRQLLQANHEILLETSVILGKGSWEWMRLSLKTCVHPHPICWGAPVISSKIPVPPEHLGRVWRTPVSVLASSSPTRYRGPRVVTPGRRAISPWNLEIWRLSLTALHSLQRDLSSLTLSLFPQCIEMGLGKTGPDHVAKGNGQRQLGCRSPGSSISSFRYSSTVPHLKPLEPDEFQNSDFFKNYFS